MATAFQIDPVLLASVVESSITSLKLYQLNELGIYRANYLGR